MNTATVEEFEDHPATYLAAVEHGEPVLIARGEKPVARLLPVETDHSVEVEHENWARTALANLARACGPNEPEYTTASIIEPNPAYRP